MGHAVRDIPQVAIDQLYKWCIQRVTFSDMRKWQCLKLERIKYARFSYNSKNEAYFDYILADSSSKHMHRILLKELDYSDYMAFHTFFAQAWKDLKQKDELHRES